MITQQELNAVERRSRQDAAAAPSVRDICDGEGRVSRRIPKKMYWNAVQNHGIDPADEGYWSDMERVCPFIVPDRVGKIGVGGHGGGGVPRNRFGRISSRTIYRGGRKIQVI